MTYVRDASTFAGRIFAACKYLGWAKAARAAGVSENRLRQLSNPARNDAAVLDTLFKLDKACQTLGGGAPILDLWAGRLGNPSQPSAKFMATIRVGIASLRALAFSLERLGCPVPALHPVLMRG